MFTVGGSNSKVVFEAKKRGNGDWREGESDLKRKIVVKKELFFADALQIAFKKTMGSQFSDCTEMQ